MELTQIVLNLLVPKKQGTPYMALSGKVKKNKTKLINVNKHCLSALWYYIINWGIAAFNKLRNILVIDKIEAKIFHNIVLFKSNQDEKHFLVVQDTLNKTMKTNFQSNEFSQRSSPLLL